MLITGFFRRARSYILIATQPLEGERTLAEVLVFARQGRPRWVQALWEPLSLWLRRLFTRGFLNDDLNRVGTIRYHPDCLLESDQVLAEFFQWASELPQEQGRAAPCGPENR